MATKIDKYKNFSYEIGTIDKKNPTVVFISVKAAVIPTTNENEDVEEIEKVFRKRVRNYINSNIANNILYSSNKIMITDLGTIVYGNAKSAYITIDLTLQPKTKGDWKNTITPQLENVAKQLIEMVKEMYENNGFEIINKNERN